MIKPKELRIGNYVYGVSDRVEKVIELHAGILITNHYKSELLSSPFEHKYEEIKPIPLTKDWLIKLGLMQGREFKQFYELYNIISVSVSHDGSLIGVWIYPTKEIKMSHIKYVHQLQNLYFALTGLELCIHTTTE